MSRKSARKQSSLRPQIAGGKGKGALSLARVSDYFSRTWALAGMLFVVTACVYFPVVHHPFVNYDDLDYVVNNPRVQQGLTEATLRWAFTSTQNSNWHPLTWLSHALDCELFGLDPSGHHATSLVFHALNSVLVFLLLWSTTGKMARSLVVAMLFSLHPINVESVAWVAERKSVLCMFFFLLALAAYGWYVRKATVGRYLGVILLSLLALAAKPMVVTLPFVLLLLDIWPLQRISHPALASDTSTADTLPAWSSWKKPVMEKLPLLALAAGSSVITVIAQHRALKTLQAIPFGERVRNALFSYVMYVWKAFWPIHLSVFYSPQGSRLGIWKVTLCLAFLAAVTYLAWHMRSRKYPLIGWLWFLGTLVPMIGLVQVGEQGMADRYAYLPLLGIFVIVVWGAADLAGRLKIDSHWTALAATAVLLALSLRTRMQLQTWESSFAMWSHSLQISPENYVAEDYVGVTLSQEALRASGQACPDEAMVHFEKAIRINPHDALGHLDTGYCVLQRGRAQEAIEQYNMALEFAPNKFIRSRAYFNLGGAYEAIRDFTTARAYYGRALEIYPNDSDIHNALASLIEKERAVKP